MRKLLVCLLSALVLPLQVAAQGLPGTYKLVSFTVEVEGSAPVETMGHAPKGYLVFTPGRFISLVTAEQRHYGTSIEDRAALWDTLLCYTGPYRVEGDRFYVDVDASSNEAWNGKSQGRQWKLEGKRLSVTTLPAPYSRDPSKTVVARVVAERVE